MPYALLAAAHHHEGQGNQASEGGVGAGLGDGGVDDCGRHLKGASTYIDATIADSQALEVDRQDRSPMLGLLTAAP